ncbi:gliding motility lipoprotein GldB [Dokdonia sp. PRO95]|uniref:gliding motility lipoprotein GldB n=1 Tax=Dokdonia sp. PRO95 TaxID=1239415 RepID=UPI000555BA15|nr:gliding motility lipoprotein GldB [Dokdonia sp. PRO95]
MNKMLIILSLLVFIAGCAEDTKTPPEIKAMSVDMEVRRFDQLFAAASKEDLAPLRAEFPYLFSKKFPDEYWAQRFTDTIQQEINEEIKKVFPDFDAEEASIENLFRHIKYYFPETTVPKIVTLTTEVDYRNKVVLADSLLLIGLDTYLGEDHHFYTGIPKFQSKNFRTEQMPVDIAAAFAKTKTNRLRQKDFLSEIIHEGKKLYLMQLLLSETPAHEILGYTLQELLFAQENEKNMWEFFVKNELLYSTDRKLLSRFVNPAPFSKFYLSFDNETPGRVGRYIGFEIVKSYMDKNDVSLKFLLNQDATTIFANAKYKP